MKDPRIAKLANNLLTHSVKLEKGQTLIISSTAEAKDLVIELVRQTYQIGGFPIVRLSDEEISRAVLMGITEQQSKSMLADITHLFERADAYIGISAGRNEFELADVPMDRKNAHSKHFGQPLREIGRTKNVWCGLNYPNASMAQLAGTSLEAFEDFYFDVCSMDYSKMHNAMLPLKELMERTDKVRIVHQDTGTDLTFSIKGQYATICAGTHNIPDGEIMTTPLKYSANGKIKFNIPQMSKSSVLHHDLELEFKDGKIIKASSSNTKSLNEEIDCDEGARYLGEFAFGVNPYITKPMNDILFDEKIAGSIHIALGKGYEENCADKENMNRSSLHWDVILLNPDIYFDDVLIRKNGKFVLPQLLALENLK